MRPCGWPGRNGCGSGGSTCVPPATASSPASPRSTRRAAPSSDRPYHPPLAPAGMTGPKASLYVPFGPSDSARRPQTGYARLEVDDVDAGPLGGQVLGDEATVAVLRRVLAAEKRRRFLEVLA